MWGAKDSRLSPSWNRGGGKQDVPQSRWPSAGAALSPCGDLLCSPSLKRQGPLKVFSLENSLPLVRRCNTEITLPLLSAILVNQIPVKHAAPQLPNPKPPGYFKSEIQFGCFLHKQQKTKLHSGAKEMLSLWTLTMFFGVVFNTYAHCVFPSADMSKNYFLITGIKQPATRKVDDKADCRTKCPSAELNKQKKSSSTGGGRSDEITHPVVLLGWVSLGHRRKEMDAKQWSHPKIIASLVASPPPPPFLPSAEPSSHSSRDKNMKQ